MGVDILLSQKKLGTTFLILIKVNYIKEENGKLVIFQKSQTRSLYRNSPKNGQPASTLGPLTQKMDKLDNGHPSETSIFASLGCMGLALVISLTIVGFVWGLAELISR